MRASDPPSARVSARMHVCVHVGASWPSQAYSVYKQDLCLQSGQQASWRPFVYIHVRAFAHAHVYLFSSCCCCVDGNGMLLARMLYAEQPERLLLRPSRDLCSGPDSLCKRLRLPAYLLVLWCFWAWVLPSARAHLITSPPQRYKHTLLVDLSGLSMSMLAGKKRHVLQRIFSLGSTYFPETMWQVARLLVPCV